MATSNNALISVRQLTKEFRHGVVALDHCDLEVHRGEVVAIDNDFFGHTIDVAGLLTGQDISAQLQKRPLGDRVLIPLHMLRHGETVFLDDYTVERLSQELGRPVQVVGLDGFDLADALFAPAESRQDNGRS